MVKQAQASYVKLTSSSCVGIEKLRAHGTWDCIQAQLMPHFLVAHTSFGLGYAMGICRVITALAWHVASPSAADYQELGIKLEQTVARLQLQRTCL